MEPIKEATRVSFGETLAELAAHFKATEPRGEFVIVVAGRDEKAAKKQHGKERQDEP